jgi:cytochrome c553
MKRTLGWMALVPWTGLALLPIGSPDQPAPERPSFAEHVQPILRAHCVSCHSATVKSGGLDLSTPAAIRKGGVSGDLLKAATAEKALLMVRITGSDGKPQMPMGFKPLTATQQRTIHNWLRVGAPLDAKASVHWAYVAPRRPSPPKLPNADWVRNPIDAFVLARLRQGGLAPSPEAAKETLIRRVTLDLTGLPPTLDEIDAFLAETRPDAYERAVDRLLSSPAYGERMARPWLDLARYADSDGYEKDLRRTGWKWRDWVISAYNRNVPFDQFTVEQIAGDMLPNATVDQLVATGFNRNTMFNSEGGVDQAEAQFNVVVDRVDTTSTVWLGTTMACARCHDHKYDPFSKKDYFRLVAVFSNTEIIKTGDARVGEEKWREPEMEIGEPSAIAERDQLEGALRRLQADLSKTEDAEGKAKLQERADAVEARLNEVRKSIATALVLREIPNTPKLTATVRNQGIFTSLGDTVEARTPETLPASAATRFDRLALAQWLVDRKNPLTARVQVNRMWELHFGRGLVSTMEDFGTQGAKPSHPELLDWLAVEFMESGWDMKHMHRLLVTSATYRQRSHSSAFLRGRDPHNVLLARGPRFRMEAEMIRDQALAVSGLLSRRIGGPSVYPLQPEGVWNSPYSGEQWETSEGEDRYRRSLYTFWKRTAPHPKMLVFDAPSREVCTVQRSRTNTPLQALALLNDPTTLEAGRALAVRARREPDRLVAMFRSCTGRTPSVAERTRLQSLLKTLTARCQGNPDAAGKIAPSPEEAAWSMVGATLLNLDATITRD